MANNKDIEMDLPQLILRVETYRGAPLPAPHEALFGPGGGLLGRAPGNLLVLDDPGKYISRSHASVTLRDGRYYLLDAGSNPSIVNDKPLGAGAEMALADGDRIVIGDYVLQAALMMPAPLVPAADATMIVPLAPIAPALPLFEPPPVPVAAPLPPFAPFMARPAPAADAWSDPLGLDLFDGGAPGMAPAAQPDHVSPELHAFAPPAAKFAAIPADYDPLGDWRAPDPIVAPAPVAAPPPVPPAAAATGGDAVLGALLDGLGLPHMRTQQAPEQLARLVGEMLRGATAGTMDVLMARALTKRESHIDMTMIAPRANNPLKFFPDADSALMQMLGTPMPGYLAPLPALAGAFDDLKAHELAVIAGMRAALAAVVERFDPARIEQRLAAPGRLDKLLPAARKARMWDGMVALYGELARDADDDLQRLFGEKFSSAYEQQVARLHAGRDDA